MPTATATPTSSSTACATYLLGNNIDLVEVSNRMGHSDPSVTLRLYAHALRKRDDRSARMMDGLLTSLPDDLPMQHLPTDEELGIAPPHPQNAAPVPEDDGLI